MVEQRMENSEIDSSKFGNLIYNKGSISTYF